MITKKSIVKHRPDIRSNHSTKQLLTTYNIELEEANFTLVPKFTRVLVRPTMQKRKVHLSEQIFIPLQIQKDGERKFEWMDSIPDERRKLTFLNTSQCCIVWAMSEACIRCSSTIVALQFLSASNLSLSDPSFNKGSLGASLAKALSHR